MILRNLFRQSTSTSKEKSAWKVLRAKAKAAEAIGNYSDAAKFYKDCLDEMQNNYVSGKSSMSERYYNFKSSELRFAMAKVERLMEDRLQKK
jgi:hypothetical protein